MLLSGLCVFFLAPVTAESTQAKNDGPSAILILGDSISAGYGMTLETGWVALLNARLTASDYNWRAINASISGDTTGGGLRRLPALLEKHHPEIVIIELGGNDGLRGYPIKQLRTNLAVMAEKAQQSGAQVLIMGMEIPPNFGERYTRLFREVFNTVANSENIQYGMFMLKGIATDPSLMQADGIHPTAEAQSLLLDNVWHSLAPLIDHSGSTDNP